MVRIAGVDLPANKNVEVGLTYIYGIGPAVSRAVLQKARIAPGIRVKDLSESDVLAIRDAIKECRVEGDLRRDITLNIKRLVEAGTYRGSRHRRGLPCRGQRTRTNARTLRGKRKTVGLGKKKVEKEENK